MYIVLVFFNYIVTAIRYARRQTIYTVINVVGLSIGICAGILIAFWVFDELSYDNHFENSERIFRIDLYQDNPQTRTPYPLAGAMVRDFPEVINATSLTPAYGPNLSRPTFSFSYEDIRFDEKNVYAADSTFFDIFSFSWIRGDKESAFEAANQMIITREISEKYFGDKDPIGKVLKVNNEGDFVVSGVIENIPSNTHFHGKIQDILIISCFRPR